MNNVLSATPGGGKSQGKPRLTDDLGLEPEPGDVAGQLTRTAYGALQILVYNISWPSFYPSQRAGSDGLQMSKKCLRRRERIKKQIASASTDTCTVGEATYILSHWGSCAGDRAVLTSLVRTKIVVPFSWCGPQRSASQRASKEARRYDSVQLFDKDRSAADGLGPSRASNSRQFFDERTSHPGSLVCGC